MSLLTKQKETHRLREQIYGCQGGRMRGGDKCGVWEHCYI